MTIEEKCVLALSHRAKPKRTLERFTEAEKAELAAVWDAHGESLGQEFADAYAVFWEAHATRWAEHLAANKATAEEETITDDE